MMNATANQASVSLSHDDIVRRAQHIWTQRGQPAGQDNEIWFEAERQLLKEQEQARLQTPVTVVEVPAPERVVSSPVKPAARKRASKKS